MFRQTGSSLTDVLFETRYSQGTAFIGESFANTTLPSNRNVRVPRNSATAPSAARIYHDILP
jgi:hypothetical protein